MPLINDEQLSQLCVDTVKEIFGEGNMEYRPWNCGTSDLGDISCVMPTIHPYVSGAIGTGHGSDYKISDPIKACVNSAKMLSGMTVKMLENDAELGRKIVSSYKPVFNSIEEYFEAIDAIKMNKKTVIYNEDGTVTLDYTN